MVYIHVIKPFDVPVAYELCWKTLKVQWTFQGARSITVGSCDSLATVNFIRIQVLFILLSSSESVTEGFCPWKILTTAKIFILQQYIWDKCGNTHCLWQDTIKQCKLPQLLPSSSSICNLETKVVLVKFPEVNKTEVLLLFHSSIHFFELDLKLVKCVFRKRHKWKMGSTPFLVTKTLSKHFFFGHHPLQDKWCWLLIGRDEISWADCLNSLL